MRSLLALSVSSDPAHSKPKDPIDEWIGLASNAPFVVRGSYLPFAFASVRTNFSITLNSLFSNMFKKDKMER